MEITAVKIYPSTLSGRLRAYVSITFENSFIVREIKLVESHLGLFVSMPSRRKKDGTFKDIAHPLNNEMRQLIERKVIDFFYSFPYFNRCVFLLLLLLFNTITK